MYMLRFNGDYLLWNKFFAKHSFPQSVPFVFQYETTLKLRLECSLISGSGTILWSCSSLQIGYKIFRFVDLKLKEQFSPMQQIKQHLGCYLLKPDGKHSATVMILMFSLLFPQTIKELILKSKDLQQEIVEEGQVRSISPVGLREILAI